VTTRRSTARSTTANPCSYAGSERRSTTRTGLAERALDRAGLHDVHVDRHADRVLHEGGEGGAGEAALVGARPVRPRLDAYGQLVEPVRPREHELEVRREGGHAQDQLLELGREEVDPAQDEHVVAAAGDALHPPHRPRCPRQQARQVACAVADERQRLFRQRREHELAALAVRKRVARVRVDDLRIEVVLPDEEAVLRLDALARDAGADHLREPVDVDGVDAGALLDLGPHLVRPRLGAEQPDPE
jgi:hypothetical protein